MNDNDPIRERLKAWTDEPAISNRFNADVWAKIRQREEAREASSWASFIDWLFPSKTAWRLAAVTAAVFIAAGAGLGKIAGVSANEQNRVELAVRYAQSVDPYLRLTLGPVQ